MSNWAYQDYCNANYGPDDVPAPEVWKDCEVWGGEGVIYRATRVYEAGCGFAHDDVDSVECDACSGTGGFICEAEGDR